MSLVCSVLCANYLQFETWNSNFIDVCNISNFSMYIMCPHSFVLNLCLHSLLDWITFETNVQLTCAPHILLAYSYCILKHIHWVHKEEDCVCHVWVCMCVTFRGTYTCIYIIRVLFLYPHSGVTERCIVLTFSCTSTSQIQAKHKLFADSTAYNWAEWSHLCALGQFLSPYVQCVQLCCQHPQTSTELKIQTTWKINTEHC